MIVSRLVVTANAVINEFRRTGILELLQKAMNLAANRDKIGDPQYIAVVQEIHKEARGVIETDTLMHLPNAQKKIIFENSAWRLTPARLAEILLTGVAENKEHSMPSSELQIYFRLARSQVREAETLTAICGKLGEAELIIPDGLVSLDITIPREIYSNDIAEIAATQSAFIDILHTFSELYTGDPGAPKLIYSSTSDIIFGIGVAIVALKPLLDFYKELLSVARDTVALYAAIKQLTAQEIKVDSAALQDEVAGQSRAKVERLSEQATNSVAASEKIDAPRKKELSNKLSKKSKIALRGIVNGATVEVTAESESILVQAAESGKIDLNQIREILSENHDLEKIVGESFLALKEALPLKLEHD